MRRARPRAPSSTSSSCASSTRTACRSAQLERAARPAAATSIRSRCSAARSIGPRSASSIRPSRPCSTNTAIWSRERGGPQIDAASSARAESCTAPPRAQRLSQSLADGVAAHSVASSGRRTTSSFASPRSRTTVRRLAEYQRRRTGAATTQKGALVLAVRPVQVNPYWQHGGHAADQRDRRRWRALARSTTGPTPRSRRDPDAVAVADFDGGDVVRLDRDGGA